MTILGVDKLDLPGSGVAVSMTNEYPAPPSNTHTSRTRDHAIGPPVHGRVKRGIPPPTAMPGPVDANGPGMAPSPTPP